ncbi:hypothetical protein HAX54_052076 [Datura stramonium]|uniref:Uncharacterized protein n=1 Tax=Datura stramonium TaxID=4076 RepID=A0ABS8SYG6_DATST|nr:hypothetical protein [Datura stramonium]
MSAPNEDNVSQPQIFGYRLSLPLPIGDQRLESGLGLLSAHVFDELLDSALLMLHLSVTV